jgi:hypothetical protein
MIVRWSEVADEIAGALRLQEWHRIDDLLSQPEDPLGAADVASLLSLIVDDDQHRSELFSIVHAAESADDPIYVGGLVAALPGLIASAPWWARTLVVRVLNSEPVAGELVVALSSATDIQRTALRTTAQAIEEWRPGEFTDRLTVLGDAFDS